MEVRYAANPEDAKNYNTVRLREDFLIQNVFEPGKVSMIYSHVDRIITGGISPGNSALKPSIKKRLRIFIYKPANAGFFYYN